MDPVTIDDRDPKITYSSNGQWVFGGGISEYRSTTTSSIVAGATVTFSFSGASSISVWGTITNLGSGNAPRTSYTIDNGGPVIFEGVQLNNTVQYQEMFYQSGPLSDDSHTLVITTLVQDAFFYLDFLQLVPAPLPTSSIEIAPFVETGTPTELSIPSSISTQGKQLVPKSSSSSSVLPIPVAISPTNSVTIFSSKFTPPISTEKSSELIPVSVATININFTPTSTASPVDSLISGNSNGNTVDVGKILGGTLGGAAFVLIFMIIIAVIILKRRTKTRRTVVHGQIETAPQHRYLRSHVTPFVVRQDDRPPPQYSKAPIHQFTNRQNSQSVTDLRRVYTQP